MIAKLKVSTLDIKFSSNMEMSTDVNLCNNYQKENSCYRVSLLFNVLFSEHVIVQNSLATVKGNTNKLRPTVTAFPWHGFEVTITSERIRTPLG